MMRLQHKLSLQFYTQLMALILSTAVINTSEDRLEIILYLRDVEDWVRESIPDYSLTKLLYLLIIFVFHYMYRLRALISCHDPMCTFWHRNCDLCFCDAI